MNTVNTATDALPKVSQLLEQHEVERVLPVGISKEKQLRFAWDSPPPEKFRMTWNQHMEPNSMFVEDVTDHHLTVTVRWGLMNQSTDHLRDLINNWLAKCHTGSFKKSGNPGRHL